MPPTPPLRVAALVDLLWRPDAGGHVKCWERLAEAAARSAPEIDLTVHFQGDEDRLVERAANVRYRLHRPVFSTSRIPFLAHVPDHTDLAGRNRRLERALADADLIHTTDAFFAFAGSALRVARARRVPLVNSVHTDTPGYTRVFMARTFEALFGTGALTRLLVERLRLPEKGERDMLARLARHQAASAHALVSRADERERALAVLPPERVSLLRRGVDRAVFSPARRDRGRLARDHGVPEDAALVLFAGRVNRGKRVMVLAGALRRLLDRGMPVHLLCAGEGEERPAVEALLGPAATCTGVVDQTTLAGFFASADLFALPSAIEVNSNVVREALACGAPAAVAAGSGADAGITDGVTGLAVSGEDADWAAALGPVLADPARLAAMRAAAAEAGARLLPSWDAVLREDLLPHWLTAAGRGGGRRCTPTAS